MKRTIFILLTSTLFILVLLYFYDRREMVLNREYLEEKQFHIEYPYFDKKGVDDYLEYYLSSYLSEKKLDEYLFIDYDYYEKDRNQIELLMYIYEENGVIVRENQRGFSIDLNSEEIVVNENIRNVSATKATYDGYRQKIIDPEKPMVALTFDDGPNHNTNKILSILEKYGVKATFFLLGCNITENEKTIQKMNNLGMELGNHMYSHKLLTKLKNDQIKEEIQKVDDLVFQITKRYPTLIRPSYGTYNKRIQSIVDRPIIIWNIDTLDWKYHNSKQIYQRVMKDISDGDIILMHDIYSATTNSLKLIIPKLLKDGYQLVTVSELLYFKGIETKNGQVYSRAK